MQVSSGAKWYTTSDNQREYAISFDLNDLISKHGKEVVDAMSFQERIKALNILADTYVIGYITKEGGMTPEFAKKRLAELYAV